LSNTASLAELRHAYQKGMPQIIGLAGSTTARDRAPSGLIDEVGDGVSLRLQSTRQRAG
jgi:hypothetical protein